MQNDEHTRNESTTSGFTEENFRGSRWVGWERKVVQAQRTDYSVTARTQTREEKGGREKRMATASRCAGQESTCREPLIPIRSCMPRAQPMRISNSTGFVSQPCVQQHWRLRCVARHKSFRWMVLCCRSNRVWGLRPPYGPGAVVWVPAPLSITLFRLGACLLPLASVGSCTLANRIGTSLLPSHSPSGRGCGGRREVSVHRGYKS